MEQSLEGIAPPTASTMTIRPLGPVMAAEVIGLDVSRPLSAADLRRIEIHS